MLWLFSFSCLENSNRSFLCMVSVNRRRIGSYKTNLLEKRFLSERDQILILFVGGKAKMWCSKKNIYIVFGGDASEESEWISFETCHIFHPSEFLVRFHARSAKAADDYSLILHSFEVSLAVENPPVMILGSSGFLSNRFRKCEFRRIIIGMMLRLLFLCGDRDEKNERMSFIMIQYSVSISRASKKGSEIIRAVVLAWLDVIQSPEAAIGLKSSEIASRWANKVLQLHNEPCAWKEINCYSTQRCIQLKAS